jgi:hypothetical protein
MVWQRWYALGWVAIRRAATSTFFRNRRGDLLKAIFFDLQGYCMLANAHVERMLRTVALFRKKRLVYWLTGSWTALRSPAHART